MVVSWCIVAFWRSASTNLPLDSAELCTLVFGVETDLCVLPSVNGTTCKQIGTWLI